MMNIINTNLMFRNMTVRKYTKRIILHHANVTECTAEEIHAWHLANGWAGAGYHFFVRKSGDIYRLRPEKYVGSHAQGSNSDSIGICFEGCYMNEEMPDKQIEAGIEIIEYIMQKYKIDKIQMHKEVCETNCPGTNFPIEKFMRNKGAIKENLKVDGIWGKKTTIRLQEIFRTRKDGVVSDQKIEYKEKNPGLQAGWEWKCSPKGYSPLISEIQTWCKAPEINGYIDDKTIECIQHKLGCEIDGFFSNPSPCIMQLQKWCNSKYKGKNV